MKIATWDLESTSLRSDQGFLLCCGIKELGKKGRIVGLRDNVIPKDRMQIDRNLVHTLKHELEEFDVWITWNGKMFDVPMLNGRLRINGLQPLQPRFHIDAMWMAPKLGLTSRKLDWVARALGAPVEKTPLDLRTWKYAETEAIKGLKDHACYDDIVHHCKMDLEVTEFVYEQLKPMIRTIQRC